MAIAQDKWEQVFMDLLTMKFIKVNEPTTADLNSTVPIEVDDNANDISDRELSPAEDLINTIVYFGRWFQSNNIPDDVQHPTDALPPPLPCTHLRQNDATPCRCLHADDIPTPPPCAQPYCNNEDIPMELPAPTHVFSEAASQTPAPSHEATTPPPPPAAVASIPPASPRGCASYTGTAAKNLNPAAPPFVYGPPRAPAAKPPAQDQQPVLSKHSKQPFYATQGPSH
ncbi:hypothetical protein P691DRAFT_767369 [Macrolepiota fuliginosa MF-IS2]|uniref:Uncharacterized protein n=1 Tax=Macrolepiota fuliginosa MF-IS2 TaxID=1400762 RepID=A0A9P5WZH5_9AGAR|nr:hypothetical protein P691DRAFT_767369 [Macrolepiota fuliginosa MF-IS2]